MKTKILLVDDHAIVREGLCAILASQTDLQIVGQAADGRQGLELVARLCPDIVIMDIAMPDLNGVEVTRRIVASGNRAKVIALSAYAEKQFVTSMLDAGASGYVLKTGAADDLVCAIRAVTRGRKYLSPEITGVVVDGLAGRVFPKGTAGPAALGSREREVLQLLAEGQSSKEIADKLGISEHTVQVHRRNIMKKLDVHSVAELTKYALREGITSL